MSNQDEEHNMGSTVWQSQALESPRISLEYVRHQAEKLNKDFCKEYYGSYFSVVGCVVLALWIVLGISSADHDPFAWSRRLGALLLIPAALYTFIEIRRRGSKLTVSDTEGVNRSLHTYREELLRRRDLCFGMWRWNLVPLIPSLLVTIGGGIMFNQQLGMMVRYLIVGVLSLVGLLLVYLHYRRKGLKLQRELDALATLDTK